MRYKTLCSGLLGTGCGVSVLCDEKDIFYQCEERCRNQHCGEFGQLLICSDYSGQVESAELQYVEDYTYLGQLIGFKNNMDKELKRRIVLAWKTFQTLKFILLDKKLNRKIKIKALESCIFPDLEPDGKTKERSTNMPEENGEENIWTLP